MQLTLKKFISAFILGSTLSISGCASLSLYESFRPTDKSNVEKQLGKDEMIAIGQTIKSQNQHLDDGIVFIGKKYTYLITSGGDPFYALVKEFPANKLVVESGIPIHFNFIDDKNFTNQISFSYADPVEKIPEGELKRLRQLGFKNWKTTTNADGSKNTLLHNTFYYRGQLYQAMDANQIQHTFSQAYPLTLVQTISKTSIDVGNIGATILLAPLALSFDIVTAPIWGSFAYACRNKNCFQ